MTGMANVTAATDAGHPALAFLNTVADTGKSRDTNTFADGEALVDQLRLGGLEPGPLGGLHDTLVLGLMDLLQSDDLSRLRECRGCTHLFLDHGRGPGAGGVPWPAAETGPRRAAFATGARAAG
jgi:hypothetical protein